MGSCGVTDSLGFPTRGGAHRNLAAHAFKLRLRLAFGAASAAAPSEAGSAPNGSRRRPPLPLDRPRSAAAARARPPSSDAAWLEIALHPATSRPKSPAIAARWHCCSGDFAATAERPRNGRQKSKPAGVAELADAQDLGS